MSDQLAQVLSEHRLALTESALKKGRPLSEWVFPSSVGAPLEPNRVREAFIPALKHTGLRRIRFHDLCHSFASWLIGNGESLAYVKEQLGHHSIQITLDTCGHLIPGANRKAVNTLDDPGGVMIYFSRRISSSNPPMGTARILSPNEKVCSPA